MTPAHRAPTLHSPMPPECHRRTVRSTEGYETGATSQGQRSVMVPESETPMHREMEYFVPSRLWPETQDRRG
jgi:hypothetical protein